MGHFPETTVGNGFTSVRLFGKELYDMVLKKDQDEHIADRMQVVNMREI